MTKHDALKEYVEGLIEEAADGILNFNFSPESRDSISVITNYSDKVRKRFVTGDTEKEYAFALIIAKDYSTGTDNQNLEALNFAQAFMDFLCEKNRKKEFPDFGERCMVTKLEILQNMPNLSGTNQDATLARYMIQARIIYKERKE